MKKIILFWTVVIFFPIQKVLSEVITVDEINYKIVNYHEVEVVQSNPIYESFMEGVIITGYSYSGDIYVPSEIDYNGESFKVVGIGNSAFAQCANLTSLSIADGISYLGDNACNSCVKLKSIDIPASVKRIGESAFQNCICLESFDIPYGVTVLSKQCFMECYNLSSISIPNSVDSVFSEAFCACSKLRTLLIPNSVKWMELSFQGCNLEAMIVEDPVSIHFPNYSFSDYPDYKYNPLKDLGSNCVLYVPVDYVSYCKQTEPWANSFKEIRNYDITSISWAKSAGLFPLSYYDMSGRIILNSDKGFYLIRYSDGTIKKVRLY